MTEASYVNIPVIAFCNTNSPLRYIDIAIPCNNHVCNNYMLNYGSLTLLPLPLQGKYSLGLMWWFLCREVLRLRGSISRELPWEIMPDLFFYRDPEEVCMINSTPSSSEVVSHMALCVFVRLRRRNRPSERLKRPRLWLSRLTSGPRSCHPLRQQLIQQGSGILQEM